MPNPTPLRRQSPGLHRQRRCRHGGVILTGLVVLAVLALTTLTAWQLHTRNAAADAHRFESLKARLHDEILRRVKVYRYGLNGTRSVFAANEKLDREGFRSVLKVRNLQEEFPAATGLGYIDRVPTAKLEDYLARARADGAPDFAVRMLADQVTHDDLFVIRYIEPVEHNRLAVGLDIGQESRRREAAEYAMLTGDAGLTRQITLVQATGDGPGFLMLLPHYRMGLPTDTPEQRNAALEGWVYMTILAERLFAGAGDLINHELDFKVFDTLDLAPDQILYDDTKTLAGATQDQLDRAFDHQRHHSLVTVPVGGRSWQVAMSSTPRFRAESVASVWIIAGVGVLLAALLGLLMQTQASSLRRAQALAKEMTADLRRVALTDRLTGLPNRAAVLSRVQEAIDHGRRNPEHHYTVLFLDLNRFKSINDNLGHTAGDELLVAVSERLRCGLSTMHKAGQLGEGSIAARLGGDEFVVLLNGLSSPAAGAALADRLRDELGEPCRVSGRELRAAASVGMVHRESAYFSAEELIRDADTAMYEAKSRGCDHCLPFDISMRTRITDRLRIENDLRGAIGRGEFFLDYQPIVALDTGAVESCEALIRWRHPELGILSPNAFIAVAEANGLIVPLGAWVLNEALAQLARWRRDPAVQAGAPVPSVSVNLSRKQLILPDLPDQVLEAVAQHGADPSQLQLEVTESQIMKDRDTATGSLRRLREAGIKIAIDDFGTGHSSLACLHAFPSDVLKIDRAFVANLDRDADLVALLRSVTEMARTLGKRVVAEGIETDAQHHLLRGLSCDLGQGYLFSHPLPPEQAILFGAQYTPARVA